MAERFVRPAAEPRVVRRRPKVNPGKKMSGATKEVGAPEIRIAVPLELVLTPRGKDLIPVLGPVVTARPRRIIRSRFEVNL
jgi:hypothetical protein